MTEKELRHLSRRELLEILLGQTKEIISLRDKVSKLESELNERKISIAESGSMAEAVLKLNCIFADADKAAEQYIENIKINEQESQRLLEEARSEADRIIADAEKIKAKKICEGNLYINDVRQVVNQYIEKTKNKKKAVDDD